MKLPQNWRRKQAQGFRQPASLAGPQIVPPADNPAPCGIFRQKPRVLLQSISPVLTPSLPGDSLLFAHFLPAVVWQFNCNFQGREIFKYSSNGN